MNSSPWKMVPVSECCELIVDCVNKTAPTVPYPTPYKMIRTTNVRNGFIDLTECKYVTYETYKKWSRRVTVQEGDVILTREAPIGQVGLVRSSDTVFLGQRLMLYRTNRSVLDPHYLVYAFLSPLLQAQFRAHEGSGSVVSHIRVGDCYNFKIPLPPLSEQRRISTLLGALDDKILLLRNQNLILDLIARTVFKSWFIDFDPVRAKAEGREPDGLDPGTNALFPDTFEDSELGPIPHGWRVDSLGNVFDLNPRRDLAKGTIATYLDMQSTPTIGHRPSSLRKREFGSGVKFMNGDTLLARITPCLENGKTAYVDFLQEGRVGWGSTELIVLRPKPPLPPFFGYLLARDPRFRAFAINSMTGSSGRQRVDVGSLARYKLVVPDAAVAEAFGRVVEPLRARIAANSEMQATLAALRDTLLPRLISGKLRVPEAEQALKEVL